MNNSWHLCPEWLVRKNEAKLNRKYNLNIYKKCIGLVGKRLTNDEWPNIAMKLGFQFASPIHPKRKKIYVNKRKG